MTGINAIINAFNTIVTQNPLTMSWDIPHLDLSVLLVIVHFMLFHVWVFQHPMGEIFSGGHPFGYFCCGIYPV